RRSWFPAVLFAASVGLPTAAAAPALAIVQSADADPGNHNLFIAGLNLGTTAPAVFLGDTRLTVVSFSPTIVVAALPANVQAASYLLTVTPQGSVPAVFWVTIGAVGPPGATGATGPTGP